VRRRLEEAVKASVPVVYQLAQARELSDVTLGHQRRTSRLVLVVAQRLGLPAKVRLELGVAACVHDIGKIAVPRAILDKRGPLTAAERRIAETHTTIGWQLLSGSASSALADAADIALLHHENVDGSGYPLGLTGDAIPFAARLVRVCDAFDALLSDRPYRPARSLAEALEVIQAGRDRIFDAQIVDALAALATHVVDRRVHLAA